MDHFHQRTSQLLRFAYCISVADHVCGYFRLLLLECTGFLRFRRHGITDARPDVPDERERADHQATAVERERHWAVLHSHDYDAPVRGREANGYHRAPYHIARSR